MALMKNVIISISWDDILGSNRKDFTSQEDFKKFLKEYQEITNLLN